MLFFNAANVIVGGVAMQLPISVPVVPTAKASVVNGTLETT